MDTTEYQGGKIPPVSEQLIINADSPLISSQESRKVEDLLINQGAELGVDFEEDDSVSKSKQGACRKLAHWISWWMIAVLLFNIVLVSLWLYYYYAKSGEQCDGALVWKWWLFLLVAVDSYVLVRVLVYFIKMFLEAICLASIVYFYVYPLGWPIALFIWNFLWWLVWKPYLLDPIASANTQNRLNSLFYILLALAIAFFVKTILTQFLIMRLSKSRFWKKMAKSLFKERVVYVLLKGKRHHYVTNTRQEGKDEDEHSNIFGEFKFISFIPHLTLQDVQQNIAINQRLKLLLSEGKGPLHKKKTKAEIMKEAERAANKIWEVLDETKKGFVEEVDFYSFFSPQSVARKAFNLFKQDPKSEVLYKSDIVTVVKNIFRDRKILVKNLQNRKSIAGVMSQILDVVALVIVGLFALFIMDVNIQASIVPLGSALLAFTFIFGNSLKNAFEAFLFLFFVKAYDVGDRISVGGETFTVSKINLLSTYAYDSDGRKIVIPTIKIASDAVINYQRSKNYPAKLRLIVGFDTPSGDLLKLKEMIHDWLKKDSETWNAHEFSFHLTSLEAQNQVVIDINAQMSNITWATPTKYLAARTALIYFVKDATTKLGIKYVNIPQPITFIDPKQWEELKKKE
jgi:small-conductance mechanosensitive channel